MQEITNPQQGNPALENAYKLAQSKGYKKDINSFKNLISSNEAALNDIYNEVKNKGYKKDINSFKELVGVTSLKKRWYEIQFCIYIGFSKTGFGTEKWFFGFTRV